MRASGAQIRRTAWPRRIRPCDSARMRSSWPPQPSEASVWTMLSGAVMGGKSAVKSRSRAFGGVLHPVQARVGTVQREQLGMAAALDHASALEHHDAVGALDGGQPV